MAQLQLNVGSKTSNPWDDLRVPLETSRPGGANDPDYIKLLDDGGGPASTGVDAWHFDSSSEEELFFTVQLPHAWKEGSAIAPHVHWCPVNGNAGNVTWGLEYSVASLDSALGNTTLITVTDPSSEVAYGHQLASLPQITMTGETISCMILCRLYRDVDNGDTYGSDAAALEFDFHYQLDSAGSSTELVK